MFHILNGDALLSRFPSAIQGKLIVARECLVDGDVSGNDYQAFMATRAKVIASYPGCTEADYFAQSKTEYDKIIALSKNDKVVLWFELDLFCQVNMWYVCALLAQSNVTDIHWAFPNKGNEYSFAHMSDEELQQAFEDSLPILSTELNFLAKCWQVYQQQVANSFISLLTEIPSTLSKIVPAIQAQIKRQPDDNGLGYPDRKLLEIMKTLNTNGTLSFPNAFKQFYHSMAVYSFGDLQVKAMYDRLMSDYIMLEAPIK